jgi:hypothetical protein
VPSCRSRSIRRRAWSDAATIRLREAASSDLVSAFAVAVASSSVNGPAGRQPVHRVDPGGASGAVDLGRGHSRLEHPSRPGREIEALRDADEDDGWFVVLEPEHRRPRPE